MAEQDRILREPEVKRLTGIGRTTRLEMESRGEFPKRRKITDRIRGYSEREVLAWIRDRLRSQEERQDGGAA